ncbi:MAG: lysophospholipid acyltransferase family protein [Balneolaceae bacterium]
MKHIRAVFKLFLIVSVTLGLYAIFVAGWAGIKLVGSRIEPWRNYILRVWSAGVCRILNLQIQTKGGAPSPPFFLVSNHLSYTDIFVYYQTLKCTFIAKKEVRTWPVIGFITRTMGVIFIDRKRKRDVTRVNNLVSAGLHQDQGIILFPEGRTSSGSEVLPFRSPLLEYPAKAGFPVHYASVHYQTSVKDDPAYLKVAWWGDASFFNHFLKMATLQRIDCTVTFGNETVRHEDRKALADQLHKKLSAQFQPLDHSEKSSDI